MAGFTTRKVSASEQKFSFAVLADPHSQGDTWKNTLRRYANRNTNQEQAFTPSKLIVIAGDMDPWVSRHEDFQHVFTNVDTRPVFYPVERPRWVFMRINAFSGWLKLAQQRRVQLAQRQRIWDFFDKMSTWMTAVRKTGLV